MKPNFWTAPATVLLCTALVACGSNGGDADMPADEITTPTTATDNAMDTSEADTSPVLNIRRERNRRGDRPNDAERQRSFDGSDNNRRDFAMNQAHTPLARWAEVAYGDLVTTLAGASRPNPRAISNAVNAQTIDMPNPLNASDFLWQWGQFIDHDVDLTDGVEPAEPANIAVPTGDPWFDPNARGGVVMELNRSLYDEATGTDTVNPRQQINEITGWIDASHVYGSDIDRALALRTLDGSGSLKVSAGNLLPFNTDGLANAGGDGAELFLAGDVRANEQLGLTVMHTLFVREHNRLVAELAAERPELSGDELYNAARRLIAAQMQIITFEEFLPLLLGPAAIGPYRGYDESLDARIANEFSTAAFRLGHSMLSGTLRRLDANGNTIDLGDLPLREAFFAPDTIDAQGGLEPLLRGLAAQVCQTIDVFVVDDVRNFLFGPPGSGGFDLVALNIQRGRDHGIADYNSLRESVGLAPQASFADVTTSLELQDRLSSVYGSVADIDPWVGGLAEDALPGSLLGELFYTIVRRQFLRLRNGDRFWYERSLSDAERRRVEGVRLADIIRRNTDIGDEISDNVFIVSP
ncbi:MAG: peroxidase family protein [Pseudomonadota bacterium]